jgi:hypothetical protein
MDLADEPNTLTVEEAAKVLRIGRTAAYALAREWRRTNGASGLPVLELGRTLRVPRHALQLMLEGRQVSGGEAEGASRARGHHPVAQRRPAPTQGALWTDRAADP